MLLHFPPICYEAGGQCDTQMKRKLPFSENVPRNRSKPYQPFTFGEAFYSSQQISVNKWKKKYFLKETKLPPLLVFTDW